MNILVATDLSEHSQPAIRWGAFLSRQLGSDLTVVHAVDLASGDNAWRVLVETPEEIERNAVQEARQRLEEFVDETLEERPEEIEFRTVLGNPVDEILEEAETLDDPIVVAGTRGKSRLQEIFLGSTARRLVRQNKAPTILVPPKAEVKTPKDVVVGVDFSKPSKEAIRRAALMARTYQASVHAVYGYVLPEVSTFEGTGSLTAANYEELLDQKRQLLTETVREVGADDVVEDVSAIQLPPMRAIVDTAEDVDAQFVFVGSHGRSGVRRFFLGNTAERVMRKSPCPVFVVPVPSSEQEED